MMNEARTRIIAMSAAMLTASCAPPSDDSNDASSAANAQEAAVASTPADQRSEPPADDAAPPKPLPAPEPPAEAYVARGQEPGWLLRIEKGRIDYQGNYGETRIELPAPAPEKTPNGRRYVTDRLTVTIAYERCNDAMSGHGYAHKVTVTADGETYDGCGGERREDWDV